MTIQRVFFIGAVVFVALAVICACIALYVFVKLDIRSVMDDLSGRTRATNIRTLQARATSSSRRAGTLAGQQSSAAIPQRSLDHDTPSYAGVSEGALLETPSIDISYDIDSGSDDIPTVVTSVGQYHVRDYALDGENERAWDQGDDLPTVVETPEADDSPFLMTTRIVLIHTDGVIAAG